jgi:hypothetical protein
MKLKTLTVRNFLLAGLLFFSSGLALAQGSLSASPNPCYSNSNGLCTTWVRASMYDFNQGYAITVASQSEGWNEKLFACGSGQGDHAAPWIGNDVYVFRLYATWQCDQGGWNGNYVTRIQVTGGNKQNPQPQPQPQSRMIIQANIDDVQEVIVRGNQVWFQTLQGQSGVYNVYVAGSIPAANVNISASATSDGNKSPVVQITQRPTYSNSYTLRMRVLEPSPGRHNVRVDLYY